jgi:hypothetical protein
LKNEQKPIITEIKKEPAPQTNPTERRSIESAPQTNPLTFQPKTIQNEKNIPQDHPFKKPALFESEIENSTEMKPEQKKQAGPGKISNRISVIKCLC